MQKVKPKIPKLGLDTKFRKLKKEGENTRSFLQKSRNRFFFFKRNKQKKRSFPHKLKNIERKWDQACKKPDKKHNLTKNIASEIYRDPKWKL